MVETNAERVRRGFDAISRGDFDPIGDLLAPDVKWHGGDPSDSEACQDREQALAVMRRAREAGGIGDGHVIEMVHYPDPSRALAALGVS